QNDRRTEDAARGARLSWPLEIPSDSSNPCAPTFYKSVIGVSSVVRGPGHCAIKTVCRRQDPYVSFRHSGIPGVSTKVRVIGLILDEKRRIAPATGLNF
ncbi:MAG TPA: hypothetical protein VG100_03755, partial [Xanthobacteraceae bacterium]|nr:hypothetical protein [Xanthobacteraceae bacterium]